ncbi:MAG: type II toxin-antitoxin system VapC family toxin [Desulfobulbaceae bacterium]|nr:type II toxin-antitoxin system VapC family toxin [Desulfobulbaceae bacterium]
MAKPVLVDSNVILDILLEDSIWFEWSAEQLSRCAEETILVVNSIIYAEVSIGFHRVEDLEAAVPPDTFERQDIPWEAAFLAGKCFLAYRRAGGVRCSPLPEFFIGAHALVHEMRLLTRDTTRYRSYFKSLELIAP